MPVKGASRGPLARSALAHLARVSSDQQGVLSGAARTRMRREYWLDIPDSINRVGARCFSDLAASKNLNAKYLLT
jgi:hypothetical protein